MVAYVCARRGWWTGVEDDAASSSSGSKVGTMGGVEILLVDRPKAKKWRI